MLRSLFIALFLLSGISIFIGVGNLSIQQLSTGDTNAWQLLFSSRLPRLIAILLSGAGLSIAGLIMQQISQNRFASPSTSGTIECAMLGYVLSLVLFGYFSSTASLIQYTLVQGHTPDEYLGRVNGLWTAQDTCSDSLGMLIIAFVGRLFGPISGIFLLGISSLLLGLVFLYKFKTLKNSGYNDPHLHPQPPLN